ncbi:MAG: hypothetical protein ABH846_03670 [Patescibacteria group bacterium]
MKPDLTVINGKSRDETCIHESERPMVRATKDVGLVILIIPLTLCLFYSFIGVIDYLNAVGIPAKLTLFISGCALMLPGTLISTASRRSA